MVLQHINKILNHPATNKSSVKTGGYNYSTVFILGKRKCVFTWTCTCHLAAFNGNGQSYNDLPNEDNVRNSFLVTDPLFFIEAVGEDQVFTSPFGCCIQEVLLCCYPALSEESINARLSLAQHLETTLHILSTATDGTGRLSHSALMSNRQTQYGLTLKTPVERSSRATLALRESV